MWSPHQRSFLPIEGRRPALERKRAQPGVSSGSGEKLGLCARGSHCPPRNLVTTHSLRKSSGGCGSGL